MNRMILLTVAALLLFFAGCIDRGDMQFTPVMEGQPAPHDGYNIGPDLYLSQGDPAQVTGAVIWIKGTDPNSIFGE